MKRIPENCISQMVDVALQWSRELPACKMGCHFKRCLGSVGSWWRHQMESFSALLTFCAGNSPVTGEFPTHKGQWRGTLMFSFICVWINAWINNREAGDLRRHRTHYDVIVMNICNRLMHACPKCDWNVNIGQISCIWDLFISQIS